MRPDHRWVGGECRLDVEDEVAVGDVEPAHAAFVLPASLEVQRERVDPAEVLDLLRAGPERRASASRPSASTAAAVNNAKPLARASAAPLPFSSRWATMTSGPGQLVPAGDATPDERTMVDEYLEIEPRRQPARVAVAGRGLVDAPQPATEGEIARLDGVEQQRPVGPPVLDEQERGIAFELGQTERRFQAADDRLEEVARDGRRVLDLTPRQVCGVASQVGDDQEAGLGCRCHDAEGRPWSRSNVNTRSSCWP